MVPSAHLLGFGKVVQFSFENVELLVYRFFESQLVTDLLVYQAHFLLEGVQFVLKIASELVVVLQFSVGILDLFFKFRFLFQQRLALKLKFFNLFGDEGDHVLKLSLLFQSRDSTFVFFFNQHT